MKVEAGESTYTELGVETGLLGGAASSSRGRSRCSGGCVCDPVARRRRSPRCCSSGLQTDVIGIPWIAVVVWALAGWPRDRVSRSRTSRARQPELQQLRQFGARDLAAGARVRTVDRDANLGRRGRAGGGGDRRRGRSRSSHGPRADGACVLRASWALTPGVVNPDVTQATLRATVCRRGLDEDGAPADLVHERPQAQRSCAPAGYAARRPPTRRTT